MLNKCFTGLQQIFKHGSSKLTLSLRLHSPSKNAPIPKTCRKRLVFLQNVRAYRLIRIRARWAHRQGLAYQPKFTFAQGLLSWAGSLVSIELLAYLSIYTKYPLIAAPFGATAVLVYGVPDSPLAQPRNVIGGNCIGAFVSVVLVQLFGAEPWVMGLAVATSIKLMKLTRTLHPPGGAVALVGVMGGASWNFLLAPVLVGSIIMVLWTFVFNNTVPGRSYPRHWL